MHRVKTNSIRNIFFFFIYPFFRQKLAGVTASQVIPFSIFFGLSSIDSRARKTSICSVEHVESAGIRLQNRILHTLLPVGGGKRGRNS